MDAGGSVGRVRLDVRQLVVPVLGRGRCTPDPRPAPHQANLRVTTGIDHALLGLAVLGDPSALSRLEGIVHPMVASAQRDFLRAAARGGAALAVLDIPLLFETRAASRCDAVVVVSAPREAQRVRALRRPGMTEAKLDVIMARQMDDAEKRKRADYVVDTVRLLGGGHRGWRG